MLNSKWLSIIIPIYNVEKYLRKCLDSLCKQLVSEVEVILVDDQSSDSCPLICDEYAQKYKNFKVVHRINGGAGAARNTGLEVATGEYITFIDPDDCVSDDWLKTISSFFREGETLCFSYEIVNEMETTIERTILPVKESLYAGEAVRIMDKKGLFNTLWTKVYARKIIEEKPKIRFVERSEPGEDLIFNCEYFSRGPKVTLIDNCLYRYYRRGDIESSLSHKFYLDLYIKTRNFIKARNEMYSRIVEQTEGNIADLMRQNLYYVYKCVPNMYRIGKKIEARKRKEFFRDVLRDQEIKKWVKNNKSKEKVIRFFCLIYKLKSPLIFDLIYNFLYSIHYTRMQ